MELEQHFGITTKDVWQFLFMQSEKSCKGVELIELSGILQIKGTED
jgi:hypothetical protein